jgi:hypothetical protein
VAECGGLSAAECGGVSAAEPTRLCRLHCQRACALLPTMSPRLDLLSLVGLRGFSTHILDDAVIQGLHWPVVLALETLKRRQVRCLDRHRVL